MKEKKNYTSEETLKMIKATERILDAYYGYASAWSHTEDRSKIEEKRQEFNNASEEYERVMPKSMQTEYFDKMRQKISTLQRMVL